MTEMGDLLLGLDVGTTSAKGVLLRADGRVVAEAGSPPYPVDRPWPGWAEQDPEAWWAAVRGVVRELCARIDGNGRVAGVAASGQGCACTLVDARGEPLRPAIIWMDTRAAAEADRMAAAWGDDVRRLNGNGVGVYNVEPKLLWLREHEPEVLARAEYTLTTTAYVTRRLSGRTAMNAADGGILFAYDAAAGGWSDGLLRAMGLRPGLYPPLFPCAQVVGEVTAEAARETGLAPGTPVVAGGEDTPAAALSAGVRAPGDAFLSLGTAAVAGVCRAAGGSLGEPRLLSYPHVLPGLTIASGSMSSAGAAVEWLLREFGPAYGAVSTDYAGINRAIAASPPGAGGVLFLPYLSGELHPILDPNARGVFCGLSVATTKDDLARAVVEGSAMAIRHNLTVAEEAGAPVGRLLATGGPTRSRPWCQAIADVADRPVAVVASGGAPIGDALLAATGVGLIADPADLLDAVAVVERVHEPRPELRARYDHLFAAYLSLYEHLKPDFAFMAGRPVAANQQ